MSKKLSNLDRSLMAEVRRIRMNYKEDIAFLYIKKEDMFAGAYAFKDKIAGQMAKRILDNFKKACGV